MSSDSSSLSDFIEEPQGQSQKRNSLACAQCHSRKKKCFNSRKEEGREACDYCIEKSITCEYPDRKSKAKGKPLARCSMIRVIQHKSGDSSATSDYHIDYEELDFRASQSEETHRAVQSNQETLGSSSNSHIIFKFEELNQHQIWKDFFHLNSTKEQSQQANVSDLDAAENSIELDHNTVELKRVQDWEHFDFSKDMRWLQRYYANVYCSLPLLDQTWTYKNMHDLSLSLLHVMYACQMEDKKAAAIHYRHSLILSYDGFNDKQDVNLFTIVTFLHFHYYEGSSYFSSHLANEYFFKSIQFVRYLELHKKANNAWNSPAVNLMG